MENYDWLKNKAVVDRMYYVERVFTTSTIFASFFTAFNMLYIKKGYFADAARSSIPPTWKFWLVTNLAVSTVLLRPLTKEEMAQQWRKRKIMGKYLYTLYHMDAVPDVPPKE